MDRKDKPDNKKIKALDFAYSDNDDQALTTNQGTKISDNQNTLKAGERGPSLLEDFMFREKITHFDHERIPERVVHARGEAAHGYFQVYEPLANITKANFLQNPNEKTPVFVRFSTVAGSRGSADTVRDVRGFAVKFYTEEGIFDLVGNNIPVFFIQDAIKFPDLIHAVKPEPDHEMPQAASAHDTFWDFVSLMPESMHMIMWVMSDRAIPRSLRMMEGFGIHTFRLINAKNESHFVKFHWKPKLGVHSLVWDEAQLINGRDPDFHRRDLWDAIEMGLFPEWELGLQVVKEEDQDKFDFDLLDATKIIPEELVPVQRVGKLVLNRNPDNFFAETEQVAFHPGHIVPGIDFTDDPLLQGRLFSYTDTQISRLGGANFHEIPINRPICPFHNNQRDGMHRQIINVNKTAYQPNSIGNDYPRETPVAKGGFATYPEKINAAKIRKRSESFADHFSQAKLFWQSQAPHEKNHLIEALSFELGKVDNHQIRENVVNLLANVALEIAENVAFRLGIDKEKIKSHPAQKQPSIPSSAALSIQNLATESLYSRKIALLVTDGVDANLVDTFSKQVASNHAQVKIVAYKVGPVKDAKGQSIAVDGTVNSLPSVLFDGVLLLSSKNNQNAKLDRNLIDYCREAFKHHKTIGVLGASADQIERLLGVKESPGLIVSDDFSASEKLIKSFLMTLKSHRHWTREVA